jgi:hypothetical protein
MPFRNTFTGLLYLLVGALIGASIYRYFGWLGISVIGAACFFYLKFGKGSLHNTFPYEA